VTGKGSRTWLCVSPSPLAHTACCSKPLFRSARNIAACFLGLRGTCTSSTSLSVHLMCRQERRGSPRGLSPRRVHRGGRGEQNPSIRSVTGYIEERAILGPGPSLGRTWRACADDVCVSRQSSWHPPSVPRQVECLEGCKCIYLNQNKAAKKRHPSEPFFITLADWSASSST